MSNMSSVGIITTASAYRILGTRRPVIAQPSPSGLPCPHAVEQSRYFQYFLPTGGGGILAVQIVLQRLIEDA